jgi:hypothetical protein
VSASTSARASDLLQRVLLVVSSASGGGRSYLKVFRGFVESLGRVVNVVTVDHDLELFTSQTNILLDIYLPSHSFLVYYCREEPGGSNLRSKYYFLPTIQLFCHINIL